ncbi:MAG: hypothetical protein ACXACH_03785, partial [Candidatus Hermodarchaeia archaeon]
ACYAVGIEPLTFAKWLNANKSLDLEIRQVESRYLIQLREKMENAPSAEMRSLLSRQLSAIDPEFSMTSSMARKKEVDAEREARDKKLKQITSESSWGYSGWSKRRRELQRNIKDGKKLSKKDAETLWSWSLSGKDKRDLQERYQYENLLPRSRLDEFVALVKNHRKKGCYFTKEMEQLMRQRMVEVKKIPKQESLFKLKVDDKEMMSFHA